MRNTLLITFMAACLSIVTIAQSGGPYSIEKNVIAGGGETSSTGGTYSLGHTSAQPVTEKSSNGMFSLQSGFWHPDVASAPTAAGVSISGKVMTSEGRGLIRASVSVADSAGKVRSVETGPSGFYKIDDLEAGQTYFVTVSSKRFQFAPRLVMLMDAMSDVDFTPM